MPSSPSPLPLPDAVTPRFLSLPVADPLMQRFSYLPFTAQTLLFIAGFRRQLWQEERERARRLSARAPALARFHLRVVTVYLGNAVAEALD